jgi:hypothetical protein
MRIRKPQILWVQGALQTKFAASFVLPVPLYAATCGHGQRGRLKSTWSFVNRPVVFGSVSNTPTGTRPIVGLTMRSLLSDKSQLECPLGEATHHAQLQIMAVARPRNQLSSLPEPLGGNRVPTLQATRDVRQRIGES